MSPSKWSRRAVLAGVLGGAGTLAQQIQRAHSEAILEADVDVVEWRMNEHGVSDLWFRLSSRATEPIEPAVICWGEERQAQQPWEIESGPVPLQPGEQAEYHISVPISSPDVHLLPGRKAILFVYDNGRDARATTTFVPTEVSKDE